MDMGEHDADETKNDTAEPLTEYIQIEYDRPNVLSSFPQRPTKIPAVAAFEKWPQKARQQAAAVLSMFITTYDNLREAAK